jgi:hypothetical protein
LQRCEPKVKPRNHISCSWKCKRVWGNEPPHSQVNSHFGNGSPNGLLNFRKAIAWVKTHFIEFFYIIKNLLERKCLKWAHMTHLGSKNLSYGQKKGQESNWQFDFRPSKIKNRFDFLMCRWRVTYLWKDLNEGYKFVLDFILIRGLQKKLWASKVAEVPI